MSNLAPMASVQFTILGTDQQGGFCPPGVLERLERIFQATELTASLAIDTQDGNAFRFLTSVQSVWDGAILAPRDWDAQQYARGSVERTLHQIRDQWANQGVPVQSLVLRKGEWLQNLDVAARAGIRAIGGPSHAIRRSRRRSGPIYLHYGLYRFDVVAIVPSHGRWLDALDRGYQGKQALLRTMQDRTTQHIQILAAALQDSASRSWRAVEHLLRITQAAIQAGTLRCETLSQTVTRLTPIRSEQSQRSILRAA